MTLTQRIAQALTVRSETTTTTEGYAAQVVPPARDAATHVATTAAPTIPAVHRALQIISTAAMQLPMDVERGGRTLAGTEVPAIVRRPSLSMSRSEFIEQLTLSLAGWGNAYVLRHTGPEGEIVDLEPLAPSLVTTWRDDKRRVHHDYDGRTYNPDQIRHLRYLAMPGQLLGIGPIQAAQATMASARDMRDYAAQWFGTGQPAGILSTDQPLTGDDALRYRNAWNHLDADGNPIDQGTNPARVRVLGKGLTYTPLVVSPSDSMWLEAQAFDALEIARIFGVPSTLMMVTPDGGSMTYSNVEQEWLGFVRFGLMAYLRRIEDAMTDLTPRGQTVRFNLEGLLRTDTASRYASYKTALDAGFLTIDEVRATEHLAPLTTTSEVTA